MTNKQEHKIVDHLFRHQYGKMFAILSNIFGLSNLELIEDAVQDTFLKASMKWRTTIPENPEAWLMQAAKNRVIDLIRQINAEHKRHEHAIHGAVSIEINEHFLDHEVDDSQLRMIFVACDPVLSQEEQIAFALKAISGFSMKEIAAALLQKEESIKKRLTRARTKIKENQINLAYPEPEAVEKRMAGVLQIIYLIFNEGFHSTKPDMLVRKDLCGEALRLAKLLLKKEKFRSGSLYSLFALMCYHAARIESKLGDDEIIDLKKQDRSLWFLPLIKLADDALLKSASYEDHSIYYLEASIAREHVHAKSFETTNWVQLLKLYERVHEVMPSYSVLLSKATIYLQMKDAERAKETLDSIDANKLNQRKYLYYGCFADYYLLIGEHKKAIEDLEIAVQLCRNEYEQNYLKSKLEGLC